MKTQHGFLTGLLFLTAASTGPVWGFYNPHTGRWLSRDPIEENGGANLYAFVNDDPVDLSDAQGLDFIAVGIRGAHAAANLQNHMSIEFYEEKPPCTPKGYKFQSSSVRLAPLQNAQRRDQFELIPAVMDYVRVNANTMAGHVMFSYRTFVAISYINRTSTATTLQVLYDDSIGDAAAKWKQIVAAAMTYKYAEQLPIGNALKNWPNSKYQLPPGNNSNTFIQELAAVIRASAAFFDATPGAAKASTVIDKGIVPIYKGIPL